MDERQINQRIATEIATTSHWNGREFRRGECVALLDGNVIAVADNLGAALQALRAIDADPQRGMTVEVAPPAVDVIR